MTAMGRFEIEGFSAKRMLNLLMRLCSDRVELGRIAGGLGDQGEICDMIARLHSLKLISESLLSDKIPVHRLHITADLHFLLQRNEDRVKRVLIPEMENMLRRKLERKNTPWGPESPNFSHRAATTSVFPWLPGFSAFPEGVV
jgi:hypothetical protein